MTARPPREEYGLDMEFDEALERFVQTNPREMEMGVAKSKKKKPPGGKRKRKPPGASKSENVISLRDRKTSLRRRGIA